MDGYDPVFLEKDEEFNYLTFPVLYYGHMDYSKDPLSILLQFRPLILVNNILDCIIVKAKSVLQLSQFLGCRTLSVYPEHFALVNLVRKLVHGLSRRTITIGFEKR